MRSIVLFRPKSSPVKDYRGVPLNLIALGAALEKKYKVIIVDAVIEDDYLQKVIDAMKDAICLGITSMTGHQIHEGLEVAKAVKEKYPSTPIVWGGYHFTILPEQSLQSEYVDIVVRGQGVRTFEELVQHLEKNLSLKKIKGISYKESGKIFHNEDREWEDVNNFPPLAYNLLNIEEYVAWNEFASRALNYISTCGCPFHCRFCAEHTVNKGRWSGLSPERVVDEIEHLVKNYNLNGIIFNDNNFFVNEDRVRKICSGIIERRLNIKWGGANGRAEQLKRFDESTWQLIEESGCYSILIGAESGSQNILDLLDKKTTVKDIIEFTEICKKYGIKIIFSFMLGMPEDEKSDETTKSEFNKTLNLINNLHSIYKNTSFMWFAYAPYPGTPLYELSVKNGFREPQNLEEWSNFNLLEKTTPWIEGKYIKLLRQLNTFIFPCVSNTYMTTSEFIGRRYGFLKSLFKLALKIMHRSALYRLKNSFFSVPIEYELIKIGRYVGALEE